MSAVAEIPVQKKILTKTYELIDSKPSSYIMDGSGIDMEHLDDTARICFPSMRLLRKTFRVKVKVDGKDGAPDTYTYRIARYIKDCPTIWKDEQDERGLKPNPLTDIIKFSYGRLTVAREGDLCLYDIMEMHEGNAGAVNRPDDAEDIFKVLDSAMDSQEEESLIDQRARCTVILMDLKKKDAQGFQYNEDALQFFCSIFKLPAYDSGFGSEAWIALAKFADEFPDRFLNSIANLRSLVENDVYQAIQLGVILIDSARAFYKEGSVFVMSFESGLNPEQKGRALADFMLNPKNKSHYENLRVRLAKAKNTGSAVISE